MKSKAHFQFNYQFLKTITMIKDSYLYSTVYNNLRELNLDFECTYIYAHSIEGRSYVVKDLITRYSTKVNFIEIKDIESDMIHDEFSNRDFNLRDNESMYDFFLEYRNNFIYIDTSGLNNRICASLLNNAFLNFETLAFKDLKVIYAEPEMYKVVQFSTEGIFNDLSERIKGIEPLPGFANIIPYENEESFLIALLGFEGGRFKYILENIEPNKLIIYPVVGVPGFRPEYPFVSYWGNRRPFESSDIWPNIKYACANSITDVYILLKRLLKTSPSGRIKIAPIGTKPHSIGAILFAIKNPLNVELIYDNPKREKQRTDGVGKIIECSVYKMLMDK